MTATIQLPKLLPVKKGTIFIQSYEPSQCDSLSHFIKRVEKLNHLLCLLDEELKVETYEDKLGPEFMVWTDNPAVLKYAYKEDYLCEDLTFNHVVMEWLKGKEEPEGLWEFVSKKILDDEYEFCLLEDGQLYLRID